MHAALVIQMKKELNLLSKNSNRIKNQNKRNLKYNKNTLIKHKPLLYKTARLFCSNQKVASKVLPMLQHRIKAMEIKGIKHLQSRISSIHRLFHKRVINAKDPWSCRTKNNFILQLKKTLPLNWAHRILLKLPKNTIPRLKLKQNHHNFCL